MLHLSLEERASIRAALDEAAHFIAEASERLDEISEVLVARASRVSADESQLIRELKRRIDEGIITVERRSKHIVVVHDHDPSSFKF